MWRQDVLSPHNCAVQPPPLYTCPVSLALPSCGACASTAAAPWCCRCPPQVSPRPPPLGVAEGCWYSFLIRDFFLLSLETLSGQAAQGPAHPQPPSGPPGLSTARAAGVCRPH